MISWITTVILSAPRRSTSGRAPWFSAIMRFWIRVESLNRPPTLLTIPSSFSSSSMGGSASTTVGLQQRGELLDGAVELVVNDMGIVPVRLGEFFAGDAQAAQDRGVGLRAARPQPARELGEIGRLHEDKQRL